MKTSRRLFLKTSGFSVIGAIGLLNAPNLIFGAEQNDVLQTQDADSFRRLIGTTFTLYTENSATTAELVNVKDTVFTGRNGFNTNSLKTGSTATNFKLIFRVSSGETEQNLYQIYHPELGLFKLLLVPGKSVDGFDTYSAVINRL